MADDPSMVRTAPSYRNVLTVALFCGLVAGVLEPIGIVLRLSNTAEGYRGLGAYLWWMPATANLVWFAVLGSIGWALARLLPSLLSLKLLAGILACFGLMSSFRILDGHLGIVTVDILAAGLAVRSTQRWGDRLERWMPRLRRAVAAGVVAVATIAGGIEVTRATMERKGLASLPAVPSGTPNILVLVLDTVRAMNLSVYGYLRPTTPGLEALAARGTTFDRALTAAPWTRPAHASLFTGQWEHDHTADHEAPLDTRQPTLAEELGRLGYRTAGFTANLTHTARSSGVARGFLHYEDHRISIPQIAVAAATPRTIYRTLQGLLPIPETRVNYEWKSSADVNRALLAWLDRSGNQPFFVFANYMDAHSSYYPRPPFDTAFSSPAYPDPLPTRGVGIGMDRVRPMRPYDQAIATIDHDIAELLRGLEERGLLENTIVVVTADHGEAFGEHGIYGHGSTLYMETVHVPLIVAWPGKVPAGLRVPDWVSTRALAATLVHLAAPAAHSPFPGLPLSRFWESDSARPETIFAGSGYASNNPDWYPTSKGHLNGILDRGIMLIREADDHRELYDPAADPWMRDDLFGDERQDSTRVRLGAMLEQEVGPPILHPEYRPPHTSTAGSR
jgi:arylsulfatase A-like enzyme